MSKSAAAALAFFGFMLFSIPMSAQFNGLLPNGNVYGGVSYAQLTNATNQQSYRGWNGSFEAMPFTRHPHLGLWACQRFLSHWRHTIQLLGGPRLSMNYDRWRPFILAWSASAI